MSIWLAGDGSMPKSPNTLEFTNGRFDDGLVGLARSPPDMVCEKSFWKKTNSACDRELRAIRCRIERNWLPVDPGEVTSSAIAFKGDVSTCS